MSLPKVCELVRPAQSLRARGSAGAIISRFIACVAGAAARKTRFEPRPPGREEYASVTGKRLLRLIPALLAAVLVLGACDKAAEVLPGKQKAEVQQAGFKVGSVRVVDPRDRPDSGQKVEDQIPKVTELMNSFYNAAFLDPGKWQGGSHPDLAPLFTAEAQPGVNDNLNNLAISDLADKIESIEAQNQSMDQITFFVDEDGSLPIGLVSVTFEALGKPFEGKNVGIRHQANYWLQPDGDSYKISAFATALTAAGEGAQ